MLVIWCFNGLVQSMLWPPILRLIAEYYPDPIREKVCINKGYGRSRIQPASATPPHLAKTSAGVLKPKHFIGVALILFTTVSISFCVVKRQLCFGLYPVG
jgi:hypothetical protein